MALTFARPHETRQHILRAAARQFVEGDVQHWWLPHSGQGVRTRISDDRVWLAFATATYIGAASDPAILDEKVPFLEGPMLAEGAHDAFFEPMVSEDAASLFEHCARGLDQCLELTGANGLPLIGTGDWNDGMNRVGEGGKGESVWLGWLLVRTIALFAPFAETRDPVRAKRWRAHAASVTAALEAAAWDGEWYRRATYDDGSWLGSADLGECEIDSIAQSWAVLSGAADPARATTAMTSLDRRLIDEENGLALLFTPPFDTTPRDPGYIKGYPPGLRENGGQYSHAAMWAILAFAELDQTDKAHALFALINPINHALNSEATEATRSSPTWSPPMSTRLRRMPVAADGPGIRGRRAGCTAPASRAFSAFAARATSLSSSPAFPASGPVSMPGSRCKEHHGIFPSRPLASARTLKSMPLSMAFPTRREPARSGCRSMAASMSFNSRCGQARVADDFGTGLEGLGGTGFHHVRTRSGALPVPNQVHLTTPRFIPT